jgi:hypothetical protein
MGRALPDRRHIRPAASTLGITKVWAEFATWFFNVLSILSSFSNDTRVGLGAPHRLYLGIGFASQWRLLSLPSARIGTQLRFIPSLRKRMYVPLNTSTLGDLVRPFRWIQG